MVFPRRRGGGFGIASFLLLYQILQVGINNIPPVTLGGIALMSLLFHRPDIFLTLFKVPLIQHVCVSVLSVWHYSDWKRLLLAGFFHLHEWHLYYNMTSFLWKGRNLEPRVGSGYFLCLLTIFTILCNATLVLLSYIIAEAFDQPSYLMDCAAGFSGVLFALKVVNSYVMPSSTQYVMGIGMPSRAACWAELLLIQVLVPNASFVGHLAGILVGLAYVHGPLKDILDWIWTILFGSHRREYRQYDRDDFSRRQNFYGRTYRPPSASTSTSSASSGRTSYTYASGPTGYRDGEGRYRPEHTYYQDNGYEQGNY